MQGVSLASFVSDEALTSERLCRAQVRCERLVASGTGAGEGAENGGGTITLDLTPARTAALSDGAAAAAILEATGVPAGASEAQRTALRLFTLLRVRALRRCTDPAFRRHWLRMRMKAMYALVTSNKALGSRAPLSDKSPVIGLDPHPPPTARVLDFHPSAVLDQDAHRSGAAAVSLLLRAVACSRPQHAEHAGRPGRLARGERSRPRAPLRAEIFGCLERGEPRLLAELQALALEPTQAPLDVRRDALFGVTALALAQRQQRAPSDDALVGGPRCFFAQALSNVTSWMLGQDPEVADVAAASDRMDVDAAPPAAEAGPAALSSSAAAPTDADTAAAPPSPAAPLDLDRTYVETFMAVFHSLLTLLTAPAAAHGDAAEAWAVPCMLAALRCRCAALQESVAVMLRMLDVYLEVSQRACALFLARDGCAAVLALCEHATASAEAALDAAGSASAGGATALPLLRDTGAVGHQHRAVIKARALA